MRSRTGPGSMTSRRTLAVSGIGAGAKSRLKRWTAPSLARCRFHAAIHDDGGKGFVLGEHRGQRRLDPLQERAVQRLSACTAGRSPRRAAVRCARAAARRALAPDERPSDDSGWTGRSRRSSRSEGCCRPRMPGRAGSCPGPNASGGGALRAPAAPARCSSTYSDATTGREEGPSLRGNRRRRRRPARWASPGPIPANRRRRMQLPIHTAESAPAESRDLLEGIGADLGVDPEPGGDGRDLTRLARRVRRSAPSGREHQARPRNA